MDDKVKEPILKRDMKRLPSPGEPLRLPPPAAKKTSIGSMFGTLVVLVILGGAGYWIYHLASTTTAPPPRGGRQAAGGQTSVGVATAVNGTVHVYVNALGTVTPLATVTVQTQINGTLQQVAFKEGQLVKKGDFLAQIDPRPYQALQAQYQGQLARDQGLLDQAKADNDRYQTLLKQNSIAKQQAEDQIFVVQQDEGTVRIDQSLIDAQSLNITYSRIIAPIDGRIGLRLVDEGNYVQASSSTGLAVITQVHPISVLFPVAEDDLDAIAPQVRGGKMLEAAAFDRANVKQLATGSVTTLDNQIDTTTGTVKLRAQFDNTDDKLFPNQFVNIKLLVNTIENVVTVPGAAIQRGAPGAYTYVVDQSDKVSVRPVTLGPADGDTIAITKGLAAGDRVVVDGADRLRDGAKISIVALDGKPVAAKERPAGKGATPAAPAADGTTPPADGTARDPSKRHKPAAGQTPTAGQTNETDQTAKPNQNGQ